MSYREFAKRKRNVSVSRKPKRKGRLIYLTPDIVGKDVIEFIFEIAERKGVGAKYCDDGWERQPYEVWVKRRRKKHDEQKKV